MLDLVLDIGLLRFAAFSLPGGLPRLLEVLAVPEVRVPAEVYNGDEDVPLPIDDVALSVLGRDIRTMRDRAETQHWSVSQRERAALRQAEQLHDHLEDGVLIVDVLRPDELPRRERLQEQFGVGRSEAASLVLAERRDAAIVYLSPEEFACLIALQEGARVLAIRAAAAA